MARKSSHISILQFDEHLISWLRVARSASKLRVLDFAVRNGAWSVADGSLAEAVQEFGDVHKIAADAVYTVLPRHDMTARILLLPSQDPQEIAGMVRLSAGEFVPYAPEELVIDQCILETVPDGQARVLAVFAHRDIVQAHLSVLEKAGIEPDQIYLSSACLASAALAARPGEDERYALINLAGAGLEALVIHGQRIEYTRGVSSAQDWSLESGDDETVVGELGAEVRSSLSAYRRDSEDGLSPDSVFLCSDWADVRKPAELLAQDLGAEVSPAWFARNLVADGVEHLTSLPLVALGAALTAQGRAAIVINLVPESVVQRRALAAVKRRAVIGGVLVAAILVVLGALYFQAVAQRMAVINKLQERIGKIQAQAQEVESKQQGLKILEQQVDQKGSVIELLAALCKEAPVAGLNISQILFQHGESLRIWGRAETLNEVHGLAQALRDSGLPQFANAKEIYTDTVQERNKRIYSYGIEIPFSGQTDAGPEE